eukprot:7914475-Karenia_brevis.AAC.1
MADHAQQAALGNLLEQLQSIQRGNMLEDQEMDDVLAHVQLPPMPSHGTVSAMASGAGDPGAPTSRPKRTLSPSTRPSPDPILTQPA